MAKRPVDAQVSFPNLEQEVLERWRERDVFAESLRRREGAEPWVFWEGPPTANGPPGVHHVLSRAFKDIFPRYRTMRGRYVERRGGWDCHGLPVEIAVEKQLGITAKEQIEQYGIAEFNQKCRESVFAFLEDWNALTERIGFWVDLEQRVPHAGLDVHRVGLVVAEADRRQGHALRGPPGRALLPALRHRAVEPRGRARLPGRRGSRRSTCASRSSATAARCRPATSCSSGRRRPWTLVSNAAVAVDPELVYVRAKTGKLDAPVVLAEALIEKVLGDPANVQILERFPGAAIDGVRYEPPFGYLGADAYGERGHTVLLADFVTADDGTGLVHTAIAFGEDDFRLGQQYGLNVVNPVKLDGTYDERIGRYAGRFVKDADEDLVSDLEARGRLLRAERYEHSYPHCWRCSTPLLYYAKPSWYIATSRIRDELLAANEQIEWHPEHIKARPLRALAGEQRRLGAVARALLGHAAAGLALRERPRHGDRLLRRPRAALRRAAWRTRTARSATTSRSPATSAARPRRACPRSSTSGSTRARCRSPSATSRSPAS